MMSFYRRTPDKTFATVIGAFQLSRPNSRSNRHVRGVFLRISELPRLSVFGTASGMASTISPLRFGVSLRIQSVEISKSFFIGFRHSRLLPYKTTPKMRVKV